MIQHDPLRFFFFIKRAVKESRSIWSLAVPVMIGQVGHTLFAFFDNLMVGRIGADNLGAASIANGIFFVVMLLGMGLSFAITPITSSMVGSGKQEKSSNILRQGLLIGIPFTVVMVVLLIIVANDVSWLDQPKEVTRLTGSYLKILAYSAIPFMIFQIYRQFIEGLGFTRPGMVIVWIALGFNIIGNYALIYGHFGFPMLGLDGAGWATFSSRILMMVMIIFFYHTAQAFKKIEPVFTGIKPNKEIILNIIRVGIPSGFQYVFEGGAFLFGAVMVGWLGTIPLAAHQIALNLASTSYLTATGISTAAAIKLGFYYGKHDHDTIRFVGFQCIVLVILFMASIGIIFIIGSPVLPYIYLDDIPVIEIATSLIIIAAFFQISDGIQAVGLGILRGIQDTKIPTLITFFAYWVIGIPIGYYFGFMLEFGVYGVWVGFLLGLSASAIFLTVRFNKISKVC